MLSPRPEHDFPRSEVLPELSGGLPEDLLGSWGALMTPHRGGAGDGA